MTSHGTPLGTGPGAATVMIGGLPAWRAVADSHTCPLSDPPGKPHVGGIVSIGSMTVKIAGLPAARMGDAIVEVGPPNTIMQGSLTVLIG